VHRLGDDAERGWERAGSARQCALQFLELTAVLQCQARSIVLLRAFMSDCEPGL
jgi:hypothetical protein